MAFEHDNGEEVESRNQAPRDRNEVRADKEGSDEFSPFPIVNSCDLPTPSKVSYTGRAKIISREAL